MTNGEAVNWIINIMSDIGKAEHQELWHYEQALAEIREMLESTQPERSEIIPDTKAVPSNYDCVNLSERVTATFYDDEHEEWSQKTVTIRDVLDSSCDEYTVINSERKKGKWIYEERKRLIDETDDGPVYRVEKWWKCSECGYEKGFLPFNPDDNFCPNCGCEMRQEGEDHEQSK